MMPGTNVVVACCADGHRGFVNGVERDIDPDRVMLFAQPLHGSDNLVKRIARAILEFSRWQYLDHYEVFRRGKVRQAGPNLVKVRDLLPPACHPDFKNG
jgi:hypothetical protein